MNRLFLGIDTSNYTTSASVADENGRILKNVKRPLPVSEGERGLRQSDAVFAHIKNIPSLFEELGIFELVAETVEELMSLVGVGAEEAATEAQTENIYIGDIQRYPMGDIVIETVVFEELN